ncbi:MAG: hypothetical protein IPI48_02460 [bacterium]|nr:hypothetical protein [bacterium]
MHQHRHRDDDGARRRAAAQGQGDCADGHGDHDTVQVADQVRMHDHER